MGVYISDKNGNLKKVATNYSTSSGESTSLAGTTWVFNSNVDSVAKNIETIPDDLNTSTWLDESDSVFKVNLYYEGTFYYGIQIVSVDRTGTPERWGGAKIDSSDAGTSITFVDGQDIADPNLIAYMNQIASKSNAEPVATASTEAALSDTEAMLIADVTFNNFTTASIDDGLDLAGDGNYYKIVIDIPANSASGTFSIDFGDGSYYYSGILVSTENSANTITTNTATIGDTYINNAGNFSTYGPSKTTMDLTFFQNTLNFESLCFWASSNFSTNQLKKFGLASSFSNITSMIIYSSTEIANLRLRIYKRSTNTPAITEGEYYKEPI